MATGDIAEGHGRPDRDAGGRIGAAHHAGRVVADGIEAGDRLPARVDHLGMGIGANAGEGTELARYHSDRIEWRPVERGNARVGPMSGRSVEALIGVRAAMELRVLTARRPGIEGCDGALQAN